MTKAELIEKLRNARREYAADSGYDAYNCAIRMAEKLDDPPLLQKDKYGMVYPVPMSVQQEPSVLEVALQIYITHSISLNLQWRQCIDLAFEMIEEFRAEEARRAGK